MKQTTIYILLRKLEIIDNLNSISCVSIQSNRIQIVEYKSFRSNNIKVFPKLPLCFGLIININDAKLLMSVDSVLDFDCFQNYIHNFGV